MKHRMKWCLPVYSRMRDLQRVVDEYLRVIELGDTSFFRLQSQSYTDESERTKLFVADVIRQKLYDQELFDRIWKITNATKV